eukprot:1160345-Pelagomonas_calceolata.AAC.2
MMVLGKVLPNTIAPICIALKLDVAFSHYHPEFLQCDMLYPGTLVRAPQCLLQKHWLKDSGLDGNNEYVALVTLCKSSFQCGARNVKVHEQGKRHKALVQATWWQTQRCKASWQQHMSKGTEYRAQQRAGPVLQLTPSCTLCFEHAMRYLKDPPAQEDERASSPHSMRAGIQEQGIQLCFTSLPSSHWQMARCQQARPLRTGYLSKRTVELSVNKN